MQMFKKMSMSLVLLLWAAAMMAEIPAGTRVTVRLGQSINSDTAGRGQSWSGTVARDVVVNGQTVAHAGDSVSGVVSTVVKGGHLKTPGRLGIRVTSIGGQPVSTTSAYAQGRSHKKQNLAKIGGGAAAGALLGGIFGGGKGALIGTAAGGAAGTGVAYATNHTPAVMGAESLRTFTVTNSGSSLARR